MPFSSQIQDTATYPVLGRKLALPPPEPAEECISQGNTPASPCLPPATLPWVRAGSEGGAEQPRGLHPRPREPKRRRVSSPHLHNLGKVPQHQVRVLLAALSGGPRVISVLAFSPSHSTSAVRAQLPSQTSHSGVSRWGFLFCLIRPAHTSPFFLPRRPRDIPAHQWDVMWTCRIELPRAPPCCLIPTPKGRILSSPAPAARMRNQSTKKGREIRAKKSEAPCFCCPPQACPLCHYF